MMTDRITVVKEAVFEAAHHLPGYDGKCNNPHGHSYRLRVGVSDYVDSSTGMVMDFKYVKALLNIILCVLDHQDLNEVTTDDFPSHMPTAENMVLWIRDRLRKAMPEDTNARIVLVQLWETQSSYAEWRA